MALLRWMDDTVQWFVFQVLAFMALLKWMDDTVQWFGAKVGIDISLSVSIRAQSTNNRLYV